MSGQQPSCSQFVADSRVLSLNDNASSHPEPAAATEYIVNFEIARSLESPSKGESQLSVHASPEILPVAVSNQVTLYDHLCTPYSQTRVTGKQLSRPSLHRSQCRWRVIGTASHTNKWSTCFDTNTLIRSSLLLDNHLI